MLYSFYIGFFALLLKIALEVRKDNYMRECMLAMCGLGCAGAEALGATEWGRLTMDAAQRYAAHKEGATSIVMPITRTCPASMSC